MSASGSSTPRSVITAVGPRPRRPSCRRVSSTRPVPHRGDEVEALDEALPRLTGDDDHLATGGGDLGRPARAREANLRTLVRRADDRRVDVRVAVDLRRAEEADVDAAGLYPVVEDLDEADNRVRRLREDAVPDREREIPGLCADRARLVDEDELGRVDTTGEQLPPCPEGRCRRGTFHVGEGAGCRDRHHLRGRHTLPPECPAQFERTLTSIQRRKRSRSRLIESHAM